MRRRFSCRPRSPQLEIQVRNEAAAVRRRPVRGHGHGHGDRARRREDLFPRRSGAGRHISRCAAFRPRISSRCSASAAPTILYPVRARGDLRPGDARGFPAVMLAAGVVRADLPGAPAAGRGRAEIRTARMNALRFCSRSVARPPRCNAADYRSVQENAAVLYDAPSRAGDAAVRRVSAAIRSGDRQPGGLGQGARPRGTLTWIEKKALGDKRMVLVTGASAEARQRPTTPRRPCSAPRRTSRWNCSRSRPTAGCACATPTAPTGFVRAAQVWGD